MLGQIKLVFSLYRKMIKYGLSHFGYLMGRQDSLEKTIMLEKVEGSRKGGRQNMRWVHSIKEGLLFTRTEQCCKWWVLY